MAVPGPPPRPLPPYPLPPWGLIAYLAFQAAWWGAQAAIEYAWQADEENDLVWRRVQCGVEDTASTEPADDAVVTFDFLNITDGGVDTSWTDSDYTTVETHLDQFWSSWAPSMAGGHRLSSYRWYLRQFAPMPDVEPPNLSDLPDYLDSGAPVRITSRNIPGSGVGLVPPQVAISVTEEVATRRNWGRFYLPFPATSIFAPTGRLNVTNVQSIAANVQTFFEATQADDFPIVVPITRIDKQRTHQLLTIGSIRVDDVADTIRRRRFKTALFRDIRPVP